MLFVTIPQTTSGYGGWRVYLTSILKHNGQVLQQTSQLECCENTDPPLSLYNFIKAATTLDWVFITTQPTKDQISPPVTRKGPRQKNEHEFSLYSLYSLFVTVPCAWAGCQDRTVLKNLTLCRDNIWHARTGWRMLDVSYSWVTVFFSYMLKWCQLFFAW